MKRRQVRILFFVSIILFLLTGSIILYFSFKIKQSNKNISETSEIYQTIQELNSNSVSKIEVLEKAMDKYERETKRDSNFIIYTIIGGYSISFVFLLLTFNMLNDEISKRRSKEKRVRKQANKLKELNQTKDTFFSIIAHDLKGPFTSLLNLFDLLKTALEEKDLSVIEENIYAVEFSARRTYNLLQNLLEWSKLQTGNIVAIPEFFEIKSIIDENLDLFVEAAKQKKIDLQFTGHKNHIVYADKNMVNNIIRNLIQNAIKFTEKGFIKVNVTKLPDFISVKIKDSGVGMTDEETKHLFKIDKNTKSIGRSREKGSGLGLILCKSFIDYNKGKIYCESEPGVGSSFYILLPFRRI